MYNHCASLPRKSQALDWNCSIGLSTLARCIAIELDKTSARFTECWVTTKKLAERLGLSESTIQRGLRELELKGFITIVKNYALRARRAIQLCWRLIAKPVEQETIAHAAPVVPAPHPEPPAAPPEPVAPTPSPGKRPRDEARAKATARQATAEEARLIHKATEKFGQAMHMPVFYACDCFGTDWVEQAINQTPQGKPWRWLLAKLEAWEACGGPPRRVETESEKWARIEKFLREKQEAEYGPASWPGE